MEQDRTSYISIKSINRNRIFNTIRNSGNESRSSLSYHLKMSLPTITQNLNDLMKAGLICESGSFLSTGGRRARAYSIVPRARISVGLDLTHDHVSVVLVDLNRTIIYSRRYSCSFSLEDGYLKKLGEIVRNALTETSIQDSKVLGVSIVVPGLVTEDHTRIFYGKILNFTGTTNATLGKYIPFPCRLYNDADAAGYGEVRICKSFENAFYICLSNNIGGAVLINHQIYKGNTPKSGEVGHISLIPDGRDCYCGQKGCFETYCNAKILSGPFEGDLARFFEELRAGSDFCRQLWEEYLRYLAIAVNNVYMLLDCPVILGGYVGCYMGDYLDELKKLAGARNPFGGNADYLYACEVKDEPLAFGGALNDIEEFCEDISAH